MASDSGPAIEVVVCHALPHQAWQRRVTLASGATAAQAVEASGFAGEFPGFDPWKCGVGVFGHPVMPSQVLQAGDRVEIYRELAFDPMESRRRRATHKARKMVARPQRTPKAVR
jgi:putative ubiquitin-RnfH superfamily antitoxin RatB of RatAB toxin-antitoxin module